MTMPPAPATTFTGALGDNASGQWFPAQATLTNGVLTLWVLSSGTWTQQFSVPAPQVSVKSAAQRITLIVGGRKYPILADPGAVSRALGLNAVGTAGQALGAPGLGVASDLGRGANQVAAAQAFSAGGGQEFLSAMRASGARVSRLGFGPLLAIGCGAGLLAVIAVVAVTMLVINLA